MKAWRLERAGGRLSLEEVPVPGLRPGSALVRLATAPVLSYMGDVLAGRYAECVRWLASVIRKAGSLDTARLIKEWEGAKFDMVWGEVEMRACDHQIQTPGYVAEVMVPEKIPLEIRYFGNEFPYIGRPVRIPRDDIAQPARDTGNRRCA